MFPSVVEGELAIINKLEVIAEIAFDKLLEILYASISVFVCNSFIARF